MPRSIASINSIAFVPYKRLGVVSEFIYVLNYLYVKYLMRDIYVSTIIEYDLLEEIFRLLNSLKSFIFISTTKRIKNDFEKKTLLLHMHIYTHTLHLYRINFSNTEKKKKEELKNTLTQINGEHCFN